MPQQRTNDAASKPKGRSPRRSSQSQTPTPALAAAAAPMRAGERLGIDADRPIDPETGAIAPQVANPSIIADTQVGWVRVNFVLGRPWSNPLDPNRPQGLTWVETYQRIIDGLRNQGLRIYGLISHEAMPTTPGDEFRDPIAGPLSNEWVGHYAETFAQIAEQFHDRVDVFEAFNEPDDWHGSNRNWIHPEWFALMLQEIHNKVRGNPVISAIRLVSGPVQGLDINNNAGADYLRRTYEAGRRFFDWGVNDVPFPFDGVGYHLYIAQNPGNPQADIPAQYDKYMAEMRQVIGDAEGGDKPIYLSEFGWQTIALSGERQAECMRVGAQCILDDPSVAAGFWFCTQDFAEKFGLYREGDLSPANRKPIYDAFRDLCSSAAAAPPFEPITAEIVDNSAYVPGGDAIPDGTEIQPGQHFAQSWVVRNTGTTVWGIGFKLICLDDALGAPQAVDVPACLPGADVRVTVPFVGPAATGTHRSTWQLANPAGQPFGEKIWTEIVVRRALVAVGGAYPPPADRVLIAGVSAGAAQRAVASTWNRFGGVLLEDADRLSIDPAVAVAVLQAESSGEPFGPDGRMIIRFEIHIFYQNWGRANEAVFRQHFTFDANTIWQGHLWRADPTGEWQSFHGDQNAEWQIFTFARGLDERAAMLSISMGAPQIMGFNHKSIGYASPQDMFGAFQSDVRNQIDSLFRFMEVNNLVDAVRNGDYRSFAQVYNGPGQADAYAAIIAEYADAYHALAGPAPAAAPVVAMAAAIPVEEEEPVPAQAPMPVSPIPGKPLSEADPELYAAWRKHIEQGFANNQVMFERVLHAFMNPYWTTVWMYRVLFGVGIGAFVVAAALAIMGSSILPTTLFCGLSIVSFLSYFLSRPLQALEENLQFITWLGIIYNTYWTRLVYAQDLETFQQDIELTTTDTVAKLKDLMDKHAERSSQRPGLR